MRCRFTVCVAMAMAAALLAEQGASAQCNPIFNPCDVHVFLPLGVREPRPTPTPLPPTATPIPPRPTPVAFRQFAGQNVIEAFRQNGLEAEGGHLEDPSDRGLVPKVCDAWRFLIPSIGVDAGGRVYDCPDQRDLDLIVDYHVRVCDAFPVWCPWRYTRANIFVMINSDLPEAKAVRYRDVLARMR